MSKVSATQEQQAVIDSLRMGTPLIEVGSFAGTGKTTLLEMCVESMPKSTQFAYLVFNKSGEKEAKLRFMEYDNVICKTIDALAYANFPKKDFQIGFYKRQDIERLLGLNFKQAKNTLDTFEAFCNSDALCIEDSNVQAFWDMQELGKIDPSFGFIRKSFHINLATIPHDLPINKYNKFSVVMLDEYQDTNPITDAIAKCINAQTAIRVGDAHQGIYSFRGASNAMGKDNEAQQLYLTQSFRFNQTIADKANAILSIYKGEDRQIIGSGKETKLDTLAMLSRTNSKLLSVIKKMHSNKIPFKTVRAPSALFDLPMSIHLIQQGQAPRKSCMYLKWEHSKFKKDSRYSNFSEFLKENAKKNKDVELLSALKIVEDIDFGTMGSMEEVANRYYKQPDQDFKYFLSSIHTAKGLEWDYVKIGDDMYDYATLIAEHTYHQNGEMSGASTYNYIAQFREDYEGGFVPESTIEEFNLLYVALTRAKVKVEYSDDVAKMFNENDMNEAIAKAYKEIVERETKAEEKLAQQNEYMKGMTL